MNLPLLRLGCALEVVLPLQLFDELVAVLLLLISRMGRRQRLRHAFVPGRLCHCERDRVSTSTVLQMYQKRRPCEMIGKESGWYHCC